MIKKRWVEYRPEDREASKSLASELGISQVLAELLYMRGIETFNEAKAFFRPSLDQLHDPFLLKDMDLAVGRIQRAMHRSEKILIYGDYDVDGTTAVSLVYSYLKRYHEPIDFYMPNRYTEGYGISYTGIDWAAARDFSLIIALDCGIKSNAHVLYAKERGVDFIIADHHIPGDTLPEAEAVLDPKRADSGYPFDELSGCGIGYKLIQALALSSPELSWNAEEFLDLLAVSIASDIVAVRGENRILAFHGLRKLNTNPCYGIKALIDSASIKNEISFNEILFQLGPRINAPGRMDDAAQVVRLLISQTEGMAFKHESTVNEKNQERKQFDTEITEQAIQLLTQVPGWEQKRSTVLFSSTWNKGVVGIVASRLIEKYYRPTIILTESNGVAAGSARSVSGFNIYEAILACSDLLEQFGGHKYAAGLSLALSKVDAFIERFEQVVSSSIQETSLTPEVLIDAELTFSDIDAKFFRILKQFEPFGPGNHRPVFVSRNLRSNAIHALSGGKHLKFCAEDEQGYQFDAIAFNWGYLLEDFKLAKQFDLCYQVEKNTWNGKSKLQLQVKDIKLHLT